MAAVMTYMSEIDDAFYRYLLSHPSEIYALLPAKYKDITGYDIDVILNKEPSSRSPEEQAALDNYNAYVKEVCSRVDDYAKQKLAEIDATPEKKEIDMAILATICYGDDINGYDQLTGYKSVSLDDVPDALLNLAEAIAMCNNTEATTGFHVELYYNESTGAYTIAFQGSNDIKDWLYNNVVNGIGGEVPQFNLIKGLASAVNGLSSNIDINLVGHSLGGALAGYLGLLTKKETYTFNAEGLNPEIINSIPDYDDSKIKAYHSSYELLTGAQKVVNEVIPAFQGVGTNGSGVAMNGEQTNILKVPGEEIVLNNRTIGDVAVEVLGDAAKLTQKVSPATISINNRSIIDSHTMSLIVNHLLGKNQPTQIKWSDTHAYRKAIASARENSALYRQDSLSIISY